MIFTYLLGAMSTENLYLILHVIKTHNILVQAFSIRNVIKRPIPIARSLLLFF